MQPAAIGPFTIERELGRGGMGEVFLATDTRLDRRVAIKALPTHLAQDADRLARFQREAKVLASLNHPGIGAIYGLEEAEGRQYLILEFIEGENLADMLAKGPIAIEDALPLAKQIAEALELAHEKGVIHRDLKPSNVMVTPEGVVKVLDFGLARTAEGAPSTIQGPAPADSPTITSPARFAHSPTVPGVIMGTAGYMSPEQARGKPVDKRSDIFSFGCVLYEMLTGAMPFRGETVADAIGAALHREPDWALLPAGVPGRVRDLLTSCLAKDRRQRLHDIGDARLELERAIAGKDQNLSASAARPRRLLPALASVAMGALVMLALGAGLWRSFGTRPAPAAEPRCVSVNMPAELVVLGANLTGDGRTLFCVARPRKESPDGQSLSKLYVRSLDRFDFEPLAGTDGANWAMATRDGRGLIFAASSSQSAGGQRLAMVPLDGSAPATTLAELQVPSAGIVELSNGDILFTDGAASFARISRTGGTRSPSVAIDAGRPNIVFVLLSGNELPDGRRVLVNVVTYGTRGFLWSLGAMEIDTGRVKILVEDAGFGRYHPSGHLVFSRGDAILAASFDPARAELLSAPVAVWGGLASDIPVNPGEFNLTSSGALVYRPPPPGGWNYGVGILSGSDKLDPWLKELKWLVHMWTSPDSRRVLLMTANARNLFALQVSPVDQPDLVKLTSEPNADCDGPAWSPDGTQIAYARIGKDDADGIYIRSVESGQPRRIFKPTSTDQTGFPSAWLPGKAGLLVTIRDLNGSRARIMRLPIGEKEAGPDDLIPFLPSEFNRTYALASNSGRAVSFASDESGKSQVWVAELRPDGTPGRPVMVKTSGARELGVRNQAWAPDGKTLYVVDERERLQKVTVTTDPQLSVSAPVEVADLDKLRIQSFAPIGNDRFLVSFKPETVNDVSTMNVVFDWASLLKQKLPTASGR